MALRSMRRITAHRLDQHCRTTEGTPGDAGLDYPFDQYEITASPNDFNIITLNHLDTSIYRVVGGMKGALPRRAREEDRLPSVT
jgi:hypothetical protein